MQDADIDSITAADLKVVTKRAPTEAELAELAEPVRPGLGGGGAKEAREEDGEVVVSIAAKKDKKPEKKQDTLEGRYKDLVRQLEAIQQNQEMLYQKQTKLKKRVKASRPSR